LHRPATTVRSFISAFGRAKVQYVLVMDLKSAYYAVKIDKQSQNLAGIVTWRAGPTYKFQRMVMGFLNSCALFQEIIHRILQELPEKFQHSFSAYFDDLCFWTETAEEMIDLVSMVLQLFARHGLVCSPAKCQLCPTDFIEFLGYEIHLDSDQPYLKIKRSRIDALLALKPPETKKDIKRLLGSCQYIAMFIPAYQAIVQPLNKLLKKHTEFIWGQEQQEAFAQLKHILTSPPVLAFPNAKDPIIMVTDTSRLAAGGVCLQLQKTPTGQPKLVLIAYASKTISNIATAALSATELELLGMTIIFKAMRHLLYSPFYCLTDHKALQYILSNSTDFATPRIKRLYYKLLEYRFTLVYCKATSPLISIADLLSRHPNALWESDESYIVPIGLSDRDFGENLSLTSTDIVRDCSYRSQANHAEISESQRSDKMPVQEIKTVRQLVDTVQQQEASRHRVVKTEHSENSSSHEHVQENVEKIVCLSMPGNSSASITDCSETDMPGYFLLSKVNEKAFFCPITRAQAKIQQNLATADQMGLADKQSTTTRSLGPLHQGSPVSEDKSGQIRLPSDQEVLQARSQDKSDKGARDVMTKAKSLPAEGTNIPAFFPSSTAAEEPGTLTQVATTCLPTSAQTTDKSVSMKKPGARLHVHPLAHDFPEPKVLSRMPFQDEIVKPLQKYVTKIHPIIMIPCCNDELRSAQKHDAFLGPIFAYLLNGKISGDRSQVKQVIKLADSFVLLNDLLYAVAISSKFEILSLRLCMPEQYVIALLEIYHEKVCAGHIGITKLYLTVKALFYVRNLYKHCLEFVRLCLQCQRMVLPENANQDRPFQPRILSLESQPFQTVTYDLMSLPEAHGYTCALVIQCILTRWIITVPLRSKRTEIIAQAIYDHLIIPYFVPEVISCDLEPSFCSQLMKALQKCLGIELKTVKVLSHASLVAERAIKSVSALLKSLLEFRYDKWPYLITSVARSYNHSVLTEIGYSPAYLLFLREETAFWNLDVAPLATIASTYDQYVEMLKLRMNTVRNCLVKLHNEIKLKQTAQHAGRRAKLITFLQGDLCVLFAPAYSGLHASQKWVIHQVGPLFIWKVINPAEYVLATIDNEVLPGTYHVSRLKAIELRGSNNQTLRTIYEVRENYNQKLQAFDTTANTFQCFQLGKNYENYPSEQLIFDQVLVIPPPKTLLQDLDPEPACFSRRETSMQGYTVQTNAIANLSKRRFKRGHLQVFLDITNHECPSQWFTVYQEIGLLRYLNDLVHDKRPITGSVQKWVKTLALRD